MGEDVLTLGFHWEVRVISLLAHRGELIAAAVPCVRVFGAKILPLGSDAVLIEHF